MTVQKKKKRVLIALGPTREYLDPVRYLSSDSSGKMGIALAHRAHQRGDDVIIVCGPITCSVHQKIKRISVTSAREMDHTMQREARRADVIIMCAAVSDWRPAHFSPTKLKRTSSSHRIINLVPNPDILAKLCMHKKKGQVIVGFALESTDLEQRAQRKLKEKGCDWIVGNNPSAIGSARSRAIMLQKSGKIYRFPLLSKTTLARRIFSHVCPI